MSAILHMETEGVQTCASQLHSVNESIRTQAQVLAVSIRSVEWFGISRDLFQYELEQIAIALTRLADEGDVMVVRAKHEMDEWQGIDSFFLEQFSRTNFSIFTKG